MLTEEDTQSSIDCSFLDDYSSEELQELQSEIQKRLEKEKVKNTSTVDVSDLDKED